MTEADFSNTYDYTVINRGDTQVLLPESEAALQWCYRFLPADCPRYSAKGFVIESRYWLLIAAKLDNDGLMSEEQYDIAMAENEKLMHQGENL